MPADDGMGIFDRLAPNNSTSPTCAREVGLLDSRVDSLQCTQECDKWGRKLFQGRYLRNEECVPTSRRLGDQKERGESGRLQLIRDVRVPESGCDALVPLKVEGGVCFPGTQLALAHCPEDVG